MRPSDCSSEANAKANAAWLSYCTIWTMMRDGRFPRSRVVGGKIAWYESDIDRWLEQLPVRRLKGDPPEQEQTKGQ